MSGVHSTGIPAALLTVPLVLGLLGATAASAGAVGSHASHSGKSLTCRGRASTRTLSSAIGPRS